MEGEWKAGLFRENGSLVSGRVRTLPGGMSITVYYCCDYLNRGIISNIKYIYNSRNDYSLLVNHAG